MDIKDAFRRIPHGLMISELRDAGYPEWLCSLTKERGCSVWVKKPAFLFHFFVYEV